MNQMPANETPKQASEKVVAQHAAMLDALPFSDTRDFEDAAMVDGATRLQVIRYILVPLARPGLAAFAVVSVTSHWNEFLWPLMSVSSPDTQVLTVGLASFTLSSESGGEWGVIAAGTALVAAPLLVGFLFFQRRFVSSLVFTGLK